MKAALLTDLNRLEVRDVPEPVLRSGSDVLLRIDAVGICGSDVHYYKRGRIGDQIVDYPFAVGHECTATVKAVGGEVEEIVPGDRVAVDPAVSCGRCSQCRAGREHTCLNLEFLGCPGEREGALSEFLVMPAGNCRRLSGSGADVRTVLSEPLSIGIYAVDFLAGEASREIAVLGAGPIGLGVILAARAAGVEPIFATDKIPARLEAAVRAGAVWTGNPDRSDIVEEILAVQPGGMDGVIECCGDQAALDQAVQLLKPGGTLLVVGIPDEERVSFDISRIRRKEIRIQNVRRQKGCFSRAVRMISEAALDMDFMITHTFALERAEEAFELVSGYRDGVIKAVVLLTGSQVAGRKS